MHECRDVRKIFGCVNQIIRFKAVELLGKPIARFAWFIVRWEAFEQIDSYESKLIQPECPRSLGIFSYTQCSCKMGVIESLCIDAGDPRVYHKAPKTL
jgi:hypothetical protein